MDERQIVVASPAVKELGSLPRRTAERVLQRISALSTDPRPRGCRKLVGSENLWRLRVGDYRVVYSIDDAQRLIDIVAVRHRRDAYR